MFIAAGMLFERHDPAAGVAAIRFISNSAKLFHLLKSLVPKMQMKYLRFAGKEVIPNSKPFHRRQNAFDIPGRDVIGQLGRRIVTRFKRVQRLKEGMA